MSVEPVSTAGRGVTGAVPAFPSLALDTLAQPCQKPSGPLHTSKQTFQKRARAKSISLPIAVELAKLGSPLEKSYRNTVYCAACIVQDDGELRSKYCGNRWCSVCSRIRSARAVNAYLPVIEAWSEPYMVTLTIRNCSADALPATIARMMKGATSVARSIKRTEKLPFVAVRKLECTYNSQRKDYHPHFHIIVNGRAQAELMRAKWLRRSPSEATESAQDVRACYPGGLAELFKYFTKLATKTDDGKRRVVPVAALDVIFCAMRGRRVWQPVGFTLPKEMEEQIEGDDIDVDASEAFKRDAEIWNVSPKRGRQMLKEVLPEIVNNYPIVRTRMTNEMKTRFGITEKGCRAVFVNLMPDDIPVRRKRRAWRRTHR
jgi:hypothetical protein